MYPTKFDNMDIQTAISSQFGFNTVNFTKQRDISSNITNIETFAQKMQLLSVAKLFGYKISKTTCCYFLFQNNFPLQQRKLDRLLLPPSQHKIKIC